MTTAFILINTETGSEEEVKKKLLELEEVVEVYAVFGIYDLVVKLEAESKEHIKTGIFQKIRKINKIQSTMTMFVTESMDPPNFLVSQGAESPGREPTT